MPIVVPPIKDGVYRISSAAHYYPALYLERQDGGSIKAVQLNLSSLDQQWIVTADEDGSFKISCVKDNTVITFDATTEPPGGEDVMKHLWSIEARGDTFIIGYASDQQALYLNQDNTVETLVRTNVREQRWILHFIRETTTENHSVVISNTLDQSANVPTERKDSSLLPLYDTGTTLGDWTVVLERIHKMMEAYTPVVPTQISNTLTDVGHTTEIQNMQKLLQAKEEEIQSLRKILEEKDSEIKRFKEVNNEIEPQRAPSKIVPLATMRAHFGHIWSVAFSPDGTRIISGSEDATICVSNITTGNAPLKLRGHASQVRSVACSQDGRRMASCGDDGTIRIWDAKSGVRLNQMDVHTGYLSSLQFSPDGTKLVSGEHDGVVRVWDVKLGNQILGPLMYQSSGQVGSVSFSPDGSYIVSSDHGRAICVWDATSGVKLLGPLQHPDIVSSVAYSPDGARIVSGCYDSYIRLWDSNSGEMLFKPLMGHVAQPVLSVAFSPDGTRIASAGEDQIIHVWDSYSGEELVEVLRNHESVVSSVAFSPDGEWIASGGSDGRICFWKSE